MVRSLPELSQNLQRLRPSPSGEPRCAALEKLLLDADHSLQAPAQIAALVSQWVDVEVAAVPSPGAEPRAVERNRSFSQLVGASLSSISPIRLSRSVDLADAADTLARSASCLSTLAAEGEAMQPSSELEQLRWLLLARAVVGLLHWTLSHMLETAVKAQKARVFWRRHRRRPIRHALWLGPAHWVRLASSRGAAAASRRRHDSPDDVLGALGSLLRQLAAHIGRARHALSEVHHANTHAQLQVAAMTALATLQRVADEQLAAAALALAPAAAAADRAAADDKAAADAPAAGSRRMTKEHRPSWFGPPTPPELVVPPELGGGAPAADGARGGVAIAQHEALLRACDACERARGATAARYAPLALPSHLSRHWLMYASGGGALLAAGVALHRREGGVAGIAGLLRSSALALRESAASFMKEHAVGPALNIYRQLVQRQYAENVDERQIRDADQLVRHLLRQFRGRWHRQLDAAGARGSGGGSGGGGGGGGGGELVRRGSGGIEYEMEAHSRLFEAVMETPAYNMLAGPLLQMLLIQTQYMRGELLHQMAAIDQLLRENAFTASMTALMPAALMSFYALTAVREMLRMLRSRRRSRRSLVKQVRSGLRDVERLLIRNLHAPRGRLPDEETGFLVISLYTLRAALDRHRVLFAPGERAALIEDMADLESERASIEQKLHTCSRIMRTHNDVSLAGAPRLRGR